MMRFLRSRTGVGIALSDGSAVAVSVSPKEERRTVIRALEPGTLEPGPSAPNINSVRDVARVVNEALEELGSPGRGTPLSLVLPDRCVTTALFPSSRRESERALLREFRSKLVFPAEESRSDTWRGPGGELMAAAVRLPVVRQYEQVVEATECSLGWVDAATLSTLPEWLASVSKSREKGAHDGSHLILRILLFSSQYTVSVLRDGELIDLRTKLRVAGDARAVAEELRRVPTMYGASAVDRACVSGEDAEECASALSLDETFRRIDVSEPSETDLLAASIEALVRRG
jgi:hypothetical protein